MKYISKKINPYEREEQLCDLWRRNLSKVSANRFDWLYRQSEAMVEVHTWGLYKEKKLCGCLSLMKEVQHDSMNQKQRGMFFDFMIDKSERTLFPAMMLVRQVIKDARECGFNYLFALANTSARTVFKRCGLEEFEKVSRWVKIIDFQSSVAKCLPGKLFPNIIANILGGGSCFLSYLSGFLGCKKAEITKNFPSFTLKGGKASSHLSSVERLILWRYLHCPTKDYFIFFVKCTDDVVSIIYHNKEKNIYIDKLLFSNIRHVSSALNLFSVEMKKQQMNRISISMAGSQLYKQLKRAVFIPRYNEGHLLGIFLTEDNQFVPGDELMFDGDMDI